MNWENHGTVWRAMDGLLEVEAVGPDLWQGIDNNTREPGPVTDLETAKAWCEGRIALPAPDFFEPDIVVIETVDGQRVELPRSEAPEF